MGKLNEKSRQMRKRAMDQLLESRISFTVNYEGFAKSLMLTGFLSYDAEVRHYVLKSSTRNVPIPLNHIDFINVAGKKVTVNLSDSTSYHRKDYWRNLVALAQGTPAPRMAPVASQGRLTA